MSETLPVPISFRLPNEHWRPADPEALGVTNAFFLAVRQEHEGDDYAPTLTVSGGLREDAATMDEIGDEAVDVFASQATDVELVKRREYGSVAAPGLLQVVGGTLTDRERRYDLRQAHVLLGMADVADPRRRVVVKVVLSTTYRQFETYLPELQDFVASIHPGQPTPDGGPAAEA
ncbi:hypothetical protein ASG49_13530 [Marmoricola sp. Leaf446]|uniref:hypothetical protein n=1 Tax=Marmoricola sp. Leaf446 TaxID=1736379 RepID=UPI0006FDF960|nr:hypothetical protein [Marmoricola sp. Leaf446]KQT90763.1 hypothetical protein ASG49_13530 [Marmoricola sp. Leaf446]